MRTELKTKRQQKLLDKRQGIANVLQNFLGKDGGHRLSWLVEQSGVNATTIWRILRLEVTPNQSTIRTLAKVVGNDLLIAAGLEPEQSDVADTVTVPTLLYQLANPKLVLALAQIGELDLAAQERILAFIELERTKLETGSDSDQYQRPSFAQEWPELETESGIS